jgi:hypothetical protein
VVRVFLWFLQEHFVPSEAKKKKAIFDLDDIYDLCKKYLGC